MDWREKCDAYLERQIRDASGLLASDLAGQVERYIAENPAMPFEEAAELRELARDQRVFSLRSRSLAMAELAKRKAAGITVTGPPCRIIPFPGSQARERPSAGT